MPSFLPFLVAIVFIFASCSFKALARPGAGSLEPDDFYVGTEASLAALFLLLEPVWDGSSPFVQKQAWVPFAVGTVGFVSAIITTLLARWMNTGAKGAKYWFCWVTGNLLGLGCAASTVWAKWPMAHS